MGKSDPWRAARRGGTAGRWGSGRVFLQSTKQHSSLLTRSAETSVWGSAGMEERQGEAEEGLGGGQGLGDDEGRRMYGWDGGIHGDGERQRLSYLRALDGRCT